MIAIDINCDMGESLEAVQDGSQEALMPYVTSVNVACGGHAGDERTMRATMEQAADRLDWMGVSKADLSFHRAICEASENAIVRTLWESLARHVLIVFGQEIRDEKDAVIMGPHHRRLRDLIAAADVEALLREIPGHILRLRGR